MQGEIFLKYKKIIFGVLVAVIFVVLAYIIWFNLTHSREETFVFKNSRTVAATQITAGFPAKLVTLVDANEIKNGKHFVRIPKNAVNITIKAPGYYFFQSGAISVMEGKEIHANIVLKKELDLYSFLEWNVIALIILFCLIAYNFYRDWNREGFKIKK